jgi:NAD(P)-dependent dehydrogenase (short-subunit alcohol dehydrogenase family)
MTLSATSQKYLAARSVIITGAGTGIGRATALGAASAGARLTLVGRRPAPLADVGALCEQAGADVNIVVADVGAATSAQQIVDAALERFGSIYGLVNNAGIASLGGVGEVSDDDICSMFFVNTIGPLRLVTAAADALRQSGGVVVNILSAGAINAAPKGIAYGASKAALMHMTRSLARDLGPQGVRVNAVSPGVVQTEIWDNTGYSEEGRQRRWDQLLAAIPLGKFGESDDLARWILHFLDPVAGAWVSGAMVAVDGGLTA